MAIHVAAVDLGATSVRVARVDLERPGAEPEIVHRWQHAARRGNDGVLRWRWDRILEEIETGLDIALERGPLASIGVDTWGVDYGLLDRQGSLVTPPVSHRDRRIDSWRDTVDRLGADRLYATTGVQLMPINTVFQLAAHDRAELDRAATLLMLPELVVHHLTGHVTAERTSAGTTGLVDVATGTWSTDLLGELDLDAGIFPEIALPGAFAGTYRDTPVHLVAGHDTASAFLAVPGDTGPGRATVSAGTWVLVGLELPQPDLSAAAAAANFSNEPSATGGVRLIRNVTGLWLLERCREAWGRPAITDLLNEATAASEAEQRLFAVDHPSLIAPTDMPTAICELAGLPATSSRGVITRSILAAVSRRVAEVVRQLGAHTGERVDEIYMVGGGARNELLRTMISNDSGARIRLGAFEATAVGNAMMQGVALGVWPDLGAARSMLAGDVDR